MKKKKVLKYYMIALVVFALSLVALPRSVTAMPEIETKLLLTAIGIDKTDEGYVVSATDVMPAESQDGTLRKLSVEAQGSSVSECLNTLSVKTGKKLELGLCGLIVIGDTFKDKSVLPDLKYLLSSGKIIPGAYLVYSPSSSAKDILVKANSLSSASSNGLATLLEHNELGNNSASVTLLDFLSDSASVTESAYMPCIEIVEKKDEGKSNEGDKEKEQKDKETEISNLKEIAIFKSGIKQLRLDETSTKGLTWLDEKSMRGLVPLDDFTVDGQSFYSLYATLMDKRVSIKTSFENSLPTVEIGITATLNLEDRHLITQLNSDGGVSERTLSTAMRSQYQEKIRADIQRYIEVTKEVDCDAKGLTDRLYRHHSKQYKKIAQEGSVYPNTQIKYKIKIKIN